MGSHGRGEKAGKWSVFDGVRTTFPPSPAPESLMADIDAAIAAAEYSHSTALLSSLSSHNSHHHHHHHEDQTLPITTNDSSNYDARLADEAYKAACAALAAGNPVAAVPSLRIAIASCPPDKASALSKLRSLLSIAQKQQQQHSLSR